MTKHFGFGTTPAREARSPLRLRRGIAFFNQVLHFFRSGSSEVMTVFTTIA